MLIRKVPESSAEEKARGQSYTNGERQRYRRKE